MSERDELINMLYLCARELDREKGRGLAMSALLDYLAVEDPMIASAFSEARAWFNQDNPDPRLAPEPKCRCVDLMDTSKCPRHGRHTRQ